MAHPKAATFFMIHGACHGAWCFEPLITELQRTAPHIKTRAIDLPSRVPVDDTETPPQPLTADVDAAAEEMERCLSSGENLVVIAHSYGGVVAGDAVGKILSQQDGDSTRRGQVLWMVYLAAYPVVEGLANWNCGDGIPEAESSKALPMFTVVDGYAYPTDETADSLMGTLVSKEQRDKWSALMTKFSLNNSLVPTAFKPGWRTIPSSFVFALQDTVFPYNLQTPLVKKAQEGGLEKGSVVPFSDAQLGQFVLDGPHNIMMTHPTEVADILVNRIVKHIDN